MSDISRRIADLPPEKRALLTLQLKEKQAKAAPRAAIPRRSEAVPPPLSFAQQRFWFLDQFRPGQPFYNLHNAICLTGPLDVATLQRSLDEIVRRHEVLRTTFVTPGDQPVQVIAPPSLTLPLLVHDLRHLSTTEQPVQVQQLAAEEAQQPFDLTQGPLLRATLLRLEEAKHVLLLTMHHIIGDLWSLGILVRELVTLYQALAAGEPSPLPELPIQYADFAHWQRQSFSGQALQPQLDYWQQQLDGALAVLELPTDRPRPASQTFRGAMQTLVLPKALVKALQALSQRQGATLFMTLLAAFDVLLYRYTGQTDLVVGTPIAGRNQSETEALIGVFLNTLALRVDLSDNPTFIELLARVREVALGAYAHQDLPFEKLVEELAPERNLSHTPLFQVMFALQNVPLPNMELPDLSVSLLEVDPGLARFDLSLNVEMAARHTAALVYNTDLFDAATASRMLSHFQALLHAIAADPEQQLSRLPLLTDAEQHQWLIEWNDTARDYPLHQTLHQLFEAQVMRTPEAIAVVLEGQTQTYRELHQQANQLAHHLRELGVGPGVRVGLCLERSLQMVVGLLGVLKAGGAYLPLDPAYPRERLAFMLRDAQAAVLLTQQRLLVNLPASEAQVVCLDADWPAVARQSQDTPPGEATADDLTYVIYTSGATGKPKGVGIPHRGVVNRLLWMQELLGFTAQDRVLQKTPLVFDVSVGELFLPLLSGARLVVARPAGHWDSAYLLQAIVGHQITFVHFVPSMLTAFLAEPGLEACNASLRYVWCGGEALSLELQERFFARLTARLFNGYGPTEASIGVSCWVCERDDGRPGVPIGRPIANTQIYLLDGRSNPVPVGVAGEVYVGGVGLAQGYLNRPELTEQHFVPHSFSQEPQARLYRTGDLARYLPDGNIEFLGRLDHQVKVRGFRIELAEIEAVLGQHPAIRQTVVLAREGASGKALPLSGADKRLIAYLVAAPEGAPNGSELRSFLKERLPDYMIPATFVSLEALPLMPNGKIDRAALPAPDESLLVSEAPHVAPQSELEQILVEVWQEVLELDRVGIHDNFFDLGGHSLLLVMVRGQLQERIGQDVPIAELFEYPTINSLARHLGQEQVEPPSFDEIYDRAERQQEAMQQQMRLQQLREENDA